MVCKEDESVKFRAHLFLLCARSDFFRSIAATPMLESQNMTVQFSLMTTVSQSKVSPTVFQLFLKYLYYGESAFDSIGNGVNLAVQDVLYLCECAEYYTIDDADQFKSLTERKMRKSLDRHTILYDLQLAHSINAEKVKDACLRFLVQNFSILATQSGLE